MVIGGAVRDPLGRGRRGRATCASRRGSCSARRCSRSSSRSRSAAASSCSSARERTPGRPVLEGYSLALVDQLVAVVASSTVISYSLYTFTARDSKAMMATIPFVALRRLPLPAADPPRRRRRGARAGAAERPADPRDRGALGAHGRADPPLHLSRGRVLGAVVLVAALAAAVVLGLGLYADFGALGDALGRFRWELFPLALALTGLNYVVRFARWEVYVHRLGIEVPNGRSLSIYLAGPDDDDLAREGRRGAEVGAAPPLVRHARRAVGADRARRARDGRARRRDPRGGRGAARPLERELAGRPRRARPRRGRRRGRAGALARAGDAPRGRAGDRPRAARAGPRRRR